MKNKVEYYIFPIILLISITMFKNNILNCLFWLLMMIFSIIKYGYQKDRNYIKNSTIRIVIISLFSYFIITYGIGLITGFNNNIFKLNLISIVKNITPPLIIIINQEVIRYIYAKQCKYDIKPYILITIIYIFLDIVIEFNPLIFKNPEALFLFICLTIIPKITYNALYSYITYNISYIPTIIIKLVFNLYIYTLPIFPNLGNYINSIAGLIYPYIVYKIINKNIKYYDRNNKYISTIRMKYIYVPIIIILSTLVILISGIGKYQLVAIGSGSMEPVIYRGDAVLVKKINNYNNIKIGTVLAYKKENILITHRVVGMEKNQKKYIFKTKGDNNKDTDDYEVKEEEIVGIVIYNIKYIGYPTIWINEKLSKI